MLNSVCASSHLVEMKAFLVPIKKISSSVQCGSIAERTAHLATQTTPRGLAKVHINNMQH